jgi:uncharacterized protein (TIGR01777 family)
MAPLKFSQAIQFPVPVDAAFSWHAAKGAFDRLNPPWQPVQLREPHRGITDGVQVKIRIPVGPLGISWQLQHRDYISGEQFCDEQVRGPFRSWLHQHRFRALREGSELSDEITFEPLGGKIGALVAGGMIKKELTRLFRYRHEVTLRDLIVHQQPGPPLRILLAGGSGLIGSNLSAFLTTGGHTVHHLVRRPSRGPEEITWDPSRDVLNPASIEGYDAIINLGGENIAGRRWNPAQKELLRQSRLQGTRLLSKTIGMLPKKPSTFLVASAVGIYGDRGEESLTEQSTLGTGFLAELGKEWEEASTIEGVRTVNLRFGVVLDPRGGALGKMLWPFLLGAGGALGSGSQWMSWIALDDAVRAILHVVRKTELRGAVNFVAPNPRRNSEFTKTLGRVLRRPTIAKVPAFVLRAVFGEMADQALLASTRTVPSKLLQSGFNFSYPGLEQALRHCLGR